MLNFQIPNQAGVAHTVVQITMALTDAGNHPQATGSGAVRDFLPPELAASVARTALSAGETTTLQWRATGTGSIAVIINPIIGVIFPPEGSTEITPCSGNTVFDLSTHNISGAAHVQVPVTVGPTADALVLRDVVGRQHRDVDRFGRHAGLVVGRRDAVGVPVGGRVTGYFVRTLQLNGLLVRPLDARAGPSDGSLLATVPASAAGFPNESGPRSPVRSRWTPS